MQILIYGAGVYGALTKKILEQKNMVVYAFIDRKMAGKQVEGIPVIEPQVVSEYRNSYIYVATKNYYQEIKQYLEKMGCKNILDIGKLLDEDVSALQLSEREKDAWMQRKAYKIAVEMDKKEGNKIVHIEAVVTERCSLKCKDCSSLMPYYKEPCNVDVNNLIAWTENLLVGVSYIGELRILGGEPFLNPQVGTLIQRFSKHEKIGMITIYTNGTVLPKDELLQIIKENDVFIHMSDYGIGEKNRNVFMQKCEEMHINYTVRKYDEWYEFGPFTSNNIPEVGLEKMYQNCISANCYTVLNGRLYHCPRAAHAGALGLIKECTKDSLDLRKELQEDQVKFFLYNTSYIDACRYCYGTGNSDKLVRAAVQVNEKV